MQIKEAKTDGNLENVMDVLSNHIIDLILENPEKHILKPSKKGYTVKKICRDVMQSL